MLKQFIMCLFISFSISQATAMGYLAKYPSSEVKTDMDRESCSAKCSTLVMKCHQKCNKKMYKPDHKHVCQDGCDMATTLICNEFCFVEPLQKEQQEDDKGGK